MITHLILEEFLGLRCVHFDRKRDWIEVKMVVLCMFVSYQRIKAPVFACGNIKSLPTYIAWVPCPQVFRF